MPQEFHVLRCYSCETFQVHIVKKSSNKWNCKVCGEKQSIKKVYGEGTAKDCRAHVQKLNANRGELALKESQQLFESEGSDQNIAAAEVDVYCASSNRNEKGLHTTVNRWSKFLSKPKESDTGELEQLLEPGESYEYKDVGKERRKSKEGFESFDGLYKLDLPKDDMKATKNRTSLSSKVKVFSRPWRQNKPYSRGNEYETPQQGSDFIFQSQKDNTPTEINSFKNSKDNNLARNTNSAVMLASGSSKWSIFSK